MYHEAYEWVVTDPNDSSAANGFLKMFNIELGFLRAVKDYMEKTR